jgi:carboxypeptidase C (cathepsin A)
MKSLLLISTLLIASVALAQKPDDKPASGDIVVTKHTITFHGAPLAYTAATGTLPIRNDDGEVEGQLFFVAYTKDDADSATRPVTFAYNGGPGSSSMWLHMGCLGPRRVVLNSDGSMPAPPFKLADNQETWLDKTDVVMVDAMGTGYSRLAKPELSKKFYSMRGDIAAFGEFIREYLAKYHRFGSPLFIAGESYGGIRTGGLSNYLLGRGMALNGAVIISGVTNFGTLDSGRGNDVPFISFLPTMAATAWYHHKLGNKYSSVEAVVADAEKFASGEYSAALNAGSSMSMDKQKVVAKKMSSLIGLSESYILNSHLRIDDQRFFKELLRDEGKTTGRLDARFTGQDAREVGDGPEYDPSESAVTPVFGSMVNDYLERELNYSKDDRYRMNNYGSGWDFGTRGGYADTSEDLRQALVQNPHMKLMFVCGYYDLACPEWGMHYTVDHMDLQQAQLSRISWGYYPAGHMVYIDTPSREKLHKDLDAFYDLALDGK